MTGLPRHGEHVRVWPNPARGNVQDGPRPVDHLGGGRFLPRSGAVVEWSPEYENQFRAGDFILHPPPCEEHKHGDRGDNPCGHCGRTPDEAQKYDVERASGLDLAKAEREHLPKHPHELGVHPQDQSLKALREEEAKGADARAESAADEAARKAAEDEAAARAKAAQLRSGAPAGASTDTPKQ